MLQTEFLFSIFKDISKYHSYAKLSIMYVSLQCLSFFILYVKSIQMRQMDWGIEKLLILYEILLIVNEQRHLRPSVFLHISAVGV